MTNASFKKLLHQYDYKLPPEQIAQTPAKPRDSAQLLVYNRASGRITHDTFRHLVKYLPPKSIIVVNQTKVIPARLPVKRSTGGVVRLLITQWQHSPLIALADRALKNGEELSVDGQHTFTVLKKQGSEYQLQPSFSIQHMPKLLKQYGAMPLPPYLRHSPLSEKQRQEQYQTVFARQLGAVAAPTASLHFTPRLLKQLRAAGHAIVPVTLHVGLGTFAPLTPEQVQSGQLHAEYYQIDNAAAKKLMAAKKAGRTIIAVGTTVARTLESASDSHGRLSKLVGETDIFIRPGYKWQFVDSLITNFHVPQSSLLMLVAALVGLTWAKLYQEAIKQHYRFFSFGDGMLIL